MNEIMQNPTKSPNLITEQLERYNKLKIADLIAVAQENVSKESNRIKKFKTLSVSYGIDSYTFNGKILKANGFVFATKDNYKSVAQFFKKLASITGNKDRSKVFRQISQSIKIWALTNLSNDSECWIETNRQSVTGQSDFNATDIRKSQANVFALSFMDRNSSFDPMFLFSAYDFLKQLPLSLVGGITYNGDVTRVTRYEEILSVFSLLLAYFNKQIKAGKMILYSFGVMGEPKQQLHKLRFGTGSNKLVDCYFLLKGYTNLLDPQLFKERSLIDVPNLVMFNNSRTEALAWLLRRISKVDTDNKEMLIARILELENKEGHDFIFLDQVIECYES